MTAKRRIIIIEIIPHAEMRYDTCGDYWTDPDGTLQIRISQMGDKRHEDMVLTHELVEHVLCDARGITNAEIDAFDFSFAGEGEPGDDPEAPYHAEHVIATDIEMQMCACLGLDWSEYDAAVGAL